MGFLILLPVILLVPFINRAFHVDDPFYVWVGQQIVKHPFDFFGFTVNWSGYEEPVAQINKNPPGVSYYIALVGGLFGWRERTLHLAFLLPAVLVALGTYKLAERMTQRPLLATLAAIVTPVFLLSAANVMAETTMFAFYVWAIFLWVAGIERNRMPLLLAAGLLAGMSALTKYFGVSLLPLLFVYGLFEKRRLGSWTFTLLLPLAMLVAYEVYTAHLYGEGHLLDAILYAENFRTNVEHVPAPFRAVAGLSFLGGCIVTGLFFAPLLWRLPILVIGVVAYIAAVAVLHTSVLERFFVIETDFAGTRSLYILQFAWFIIGGLQILALAAADLWKSRDAKSVLLLLWLLGTFLFAARFNWAINGRSLLAATAPVGILIARRLDVRWGPPAARRQWALYAPLVPALCLALAVTWADYKQADAVRYAAHYVLQKFGSGSRTVWYQGHWGFQYYMDQYGGKHLDSRGTYVKTGDVMVTPHYSTGSHNLTSALGRTGGILQVPASSWLTVWNPERGAGYYADSWGPTPYVVSRPVPEKFTIINLEHTGMIKLRANKS